MDNKWYFDEFTQIGTDYSDIKKVEAYDDKMLKFRNYKEEAEFILNAFNIDSKDIILEIGTGTGHFAIEASKRCEKVYAIDVSKIMLDYAKLKAEKENRKNIEWLNYGFLSFNIPDIKFNHIVTNAALHHLPDFWKVVSIKNIYDSLKDHGNFFLGDVIYSCNIDDINLKMEESINNAKKIDNEFYNEAIIHIKEEYSTFSWIIEGIFERVGFKFQRLNEKNNFMTYICMKN